MSKGAGAVARQAAAAIRKWGWCQHRFSLPTGAVCMRGAFTKVTGSYASEAEQEFTHWMNDVVGLPLINPSFANKGLSALKYDLADWNDDDGRTEEEVLAYLNKFAEENDPQPALALENEL